MKYNININQYELSKNKDITIQDGAIIDWLFTICGSDSEKVSKKRVEGWTWISLPHLIDDMPMLGIKTNSGASKLIKRIKLFGFIETKNDLKERKLYVKPTVKLRNLYFSKQIKERVPQELSQVPQETAQVLQDTNHNTNIIILDTTQVNKVDEVVLKKTKKQIRLDSPFIEEKEIQALWDSGWIRKKIVYNFFKKKDMHFENVKQFDSAVGRWLKVAEGLEGYSASQINKTMNYYIDKKLSWNLQTIANNISDVVNSKK